MVRYRDIKCPGCGFEGTAKIRGSKAVCPKCWGKYLYYEVSL